MSNDLACVITAKTDEDFVHYTYATSSGTQFILSSFSKFEDAILFHNDTCESEYGLTIDIDRERLMGFGAPPKETLNVTKFIRKPLFVEGVQVTAHNMLAVADWCGGVSLQTASKRPYVKLPNKTAAADRLSMAFAGDWVLKSDVGFKVYSKRSFERTFDAFPLAP